MSPITNRLIIIAGAAAGLFAAVSALSPTATADPTTPTNPGLPGLVQQVTDSGSNIPQMIQSAASVLTGAPAAPVTPPPLASASVNLPQAAAPLQAPTAPAAMLPTGDLNVPHMPGLPLPLSFATDLAKLVPGSVPLASTVTKPATAAATSPAALPGLLGPAASAATPGEGALAPLLMPTAGLP